MRDKTLTAVHDYGLLHSAFEQFCVAAAKAFPEKNGFGIKLAKGKGPTRPLSIFGHECRMRFSVLRRESVVTGRIFFERLVRPDSAERLLVLHFTPNLQAELPSVGRDSSFSLSDETQIQTYLAVYLLHGFLESLSSEKSE